jgi:hypothetical protein
MAASRTAEGRVVTQARGDASVRRFFGAALTAVGALMFGLCGLCTLAFFVSGFLPHEDKTVSAIALVVGGVPALIGFAVMRLGLSMYKGDGAPRPRPSSAPPPD